jgi:hypothetical protein
LQEFNGESFGFFADVVHSLILRFLLRWLLPVSRHRTFGR